MSDRIKYILNISLQYMQAAQPHPLSTAADAESTVRDFIENAELTVLAAHLADGHPARVAFVLQVPADRECLLFYKIPQIGGAGSGPHSAGDDDQPANRTGNGVPQLGMLTLEGGLVKSMYSSVARVFAPHVAKRADYSPEIGQIIESLHTSLGSSLGFPQSGVHSIQDELNFWTQLSGQSPTKADRDKAKAFIGPLTSLAQHLRQLEWQSSRALTDFLDMVHGSLDDLWRLPANYPQNRMRDLLDIIGGNIVTACADSLRNENLFSPSATHVADLLDEAGEHLQTWLRVCDSLTRLFWPNNGQHQWLGDPHAPQHCREFVERCADIAAHRAMFQQIAVVFGEDEVALRRVQSIFGQFKDANIFDTSPFGRCRWSKLINHLEQLLQPIDEQIATIIRRKLQPHFANPRQIVHLFAMHSAILSRAAIMKLLAAEQEQFAGALQQLIADIRIGLQAAAEQGSFPVDPALDLSPVCNECQWLRIYEQQLGEIERTTHLLDGHGRQSAISRSLRDVSAEVAKQLADNFQVWREQSLVAVQSGELTLKTDEPVVEFEPTGRQLMRVTFNPRLVTFCQDVRQLESLGLRIPLELRDPAAVAAAFMAAARRLQQIATFHNTIGDRMIPCQRPMLLANALELSRLVRGESVTWNDREAVDRYVKMLQVAVTRLDQDNAHLYQQHEAMSAIVVRLMGVDLVRQAPQWKDEMRRLHEIIYALEARGFQKLEAFRLHWDHQLYKVLEHQYVCGLTELSAKLPDIHVDLVFRQQELQFRPPLEELRHTYFEHLRKFLERPRTFRSLSEHGGRIFAQMIRRNRAHFDALYARSEDEFDELQRIRAMWQPWVALGRVNVDDLCAVHCNGWQDWDRNFKSCKHFGQQIAKIQTSEMRSGCFVVNVVPLRADIEHIGRRYWDALAGSLRAAILADIDGLQQYVATALQVLQNVPLDETGIAEAGAKYELIMAELPANRDRLQAVEKKDTCLAGWCKERVSTLSHLIGQWDQLQPLIENHSVVLQRQVDMMREHIEAQLTEWKEQAEKFEIRWEATVEDLRTAVDFNAQLLRDRQDSWREIVDRRERLEAECARFNISSGGEDFSELFGRIDKRVREESAEWEDLNVFHEELKSVTNEEWSVYRRRPYILTNFLAKWGKEIATKSGSVSSQRIRQQLESLQQVVPVLQSMQVDGLTDRHWSSIFGMLRVATKSVHDIQLADVLGNSAALLAKAEEIQSLVREAASEQVIRQALSELEQWGATAVLSTFEHRDSSSTMVLLGKDFQEVLNKIGDNQSLLQSAKNSSSFDAFSDQAAIWENRLVAMDSVLTSLNQIQRKWIYLEPIFNNGTMKSDGNAFQRVDKDFRYILRNIADDSRLLSIIKISNISMVIEALESQLAKCQNALQSFITLKRNAFPRFYFLADDDLLEILGQSSKSAIMQKHIGKLFPGIKSLGIIDGAQIVSLTSPDGETVTLNNPVEVLQGNVEQWLNQLVGEIRLVLIDQTARCAQLDTFQLADIDAYPVQVLSTAKALSFTRLTEKAIQSMSLKAHLQSLQLEVNLYNSNEFRPDDGNSLRRSKLRALLIDLVHYVEIIGQLMAANVTRLGDWPWLQQLRFYIDPRTRQVTVLQVYAEFRYSYEYLGTANRLVHTGLTHQCYLTLTQAMHMGLGGNPFGPAGTGKTECVKSLGAMLGRLVLVFNCSENVDTAAMAAILQGLARCGAWGCFDEFNRLPAATLADISALIEPLQLAIKEQQPAVRMSADAEAPEVPLDLHCGIFVTLNPAGEEYGGRQQLPVALQSLFRPIVMQTPHPAAIANVLLFTENYSHARRLGAQLHEVFRACAEMLSVQRHYDWGLRELRTVLQACGALRGQLEDGDAGYDAEARLVVSALRSNTMSKLSAVDCRTFDMLLESIFANVPMASAREAAGSGETVTLREYIEEAFGELGLTRTDRQTEKCLQLYELLTKRMGVMVFGPPQCGKSTIIAVLKQALSKRPGSIRTYTISPKSMSRVALLGSLDPDTRQWRDGVLTQTAVVVNAEPPAVTSWIICDGDVDPEWIEALNSVLDDNRLLTLPSGWRIQFGANVHFIFETHDLQHASPATISRMGIVALDADDLGAEPIVQAWLHKRNLEPGNMLEMYVESFLGPAMDWLQAKTRTWSPHTRLGWLRNVLPFVEGAQSKEEFCVGMLRGLGGCIAQPVEFLRAFCAHVLELCDVYVPHQPEPELCYYNAQHRAVEVYTTEVAGESTDPTLVRTANVQVYEEYMRCMLESDRRPAFLLVGPSGIGKSVLLQHVLSEYSGYQLVTINCSGQLTGEMVLHTIRQHCLQVSAVRGREYRPKQQRLVLYLRNVNLCAKDSWGTCAVTELLLQLVQRGGFYATETLEWIAVRGLQVVGSMSAVAEDLTAVMANMSVRFLAAVRMQVMRPPSDLEMHSILQQQMKQTIAHFGAGSTSIVDAVECLLEFYSQLVKTFTRTQQAHFVFNPRMLSVFIEGLRNYPSNEFANAFHNEIICIFRNRLLTIEDRDTLDQILASSTRKLGSHNSQLTHFVAQSSNASDLLAIPSEQWRDTVEKCMTICCSETLEIHTPITELLLRNVAHISRALVRQSGHLVLCGTTGSGRMTALHLTCTHLNVKVFTCVPIVHYGLEQFYADLRSATQMAAMDEQSIVFVVGHAWIEYLPDVMRPLEAILQGSMIGELFGDDLEVVAGGLRAAAQAEGYQDSLAAYFWTRVRRCFHLVLSLDTDTNLADLFRQYPCLYQNTEMLFMQPPYDAQSSASYTNDLIAGTATALNISADKIPSPPPNILAHLPGNWASSPLRFTQLARTYTHLYQAAAIRLHDRMHTLRSGIGKLSAANEVVDQLQQQAHAQEVELADKKRLANQSLEMISATMRSANVQRSSLLELRQQTQASGERLIERKAAIEAELRDVEPVLREATAAVGQIRGEALSEIRSLRAPPDVIRDILEGVLRLMGVRDTSWNSMKSFLAKRGVKEDIRALDPVRITPENCAAVERLLVAKADSFVERNAKRASAAAAPLATWVIANVKYARVMQSIKPLEREQAELQRNLEQSEGEMRSLTSGLDDVDGRVQELSGQLNLYTQEAAVVEIRLNEARSTLGSAQSLVAKLGAEYGNWQTQLTDLEMEQANLGANTLLVTMSITHLSHYALELRTEHLSQIQLALEVADFNLTNNIITDQDRIIWESIGLNSDVQAIENAALLTKILQLPFNTAPVPLLLDPSGQALVWLQGYLKLQSIPFETLTQTHQRFVNNLELAVRFGKCLIITDYDAARPPLLALLTVGTSSVPVRFNKPQLPVGNKLVDLHSNFRLVLVTRSPQPLQPLGADLRVCITCIPFTTTVPGFTEQLMTRTVQLRQPALETQRRQRLQTEGQLLNERSQLQAKLLQELSSAEGDILRNESLLATLNEVKQSSDAIGVALGESHRVREELRQQYDTYREYCQEAARLFIAVSSVYRLGVDMFTELFVQSVSEDDLADLGALARLTYTNIARTTPKSEHIQLGLQICRAAFPYQIVDKEWESFITSFMSDEDATKSATSSAASENPAWLQASQAQRIRSLQLHHPTLYAQLDLHNQNTWNAFAIAQQTTDVPTSVACSEFQKLLIAQCLRPELLLSAAARTICRLLGMKTLSIATATVQQLAEETANQPERPILLLTASGAGGGGGGDDSDPAQDVRELAHSTVGASQYTQHTASRGHEKQLLDTVRSAQQKQQWCCLTNCQQLADDWWSQLVEVLGSPDAAGSGLPLQAASGSGFKLWLCCDAAQPIPVGLQQKCSSLLCEPPNGIKLQLLRRLQRAQPSLARLREARAVKLRILLHILHVVLLERRRYVPQGWSQWYDFSAADGRTALLLVDWLERAATGHGAGRMDWTVLRGLCELLAYGGRISGAHDARVLAAHLDVFLAERALTADGWRPLQMQRLAVPMSANVADHMSAVAAGLPDVEWPEMLGLAAATNVQRDLAASAQLLKRLRAVHLARGERVASLEKRLRPMLSLWKKLNVNAPPITAALSNPTSASSSTPWLSFVRTEHSLANQLHHLIQTTLISMHSAAKQSADRALSDRDMRLLQLIAENQVPPEWRALWPGPRLCSDFLRAMRTRATAAQRRMLPEAADTSVRFGAQLRLGDVFNLSAYLAALKLTNAAELQVSACDLRLGSTLSGGHNGLAKGWPDTRPKVVGLMVDGATFRGNRIVLASTSNNTDKAITILGGEQLPEFQLYFSADSAADLAESSVEVPVYTNGSREQLVCMLQLETSASADAILLAGVALVVGADE